MVFCSGVTASDLYPDVHNHEPLELSRNPVPSPSGSLMMAAPQHQQGMVQMFAYPDATQAALFQQATLDPVAYASAAAAAYGLQAHPQLQQF